MQKAGVGFALTTGIVGKLSGRPKGIDLLMTLKLVNPITVNNFADLFNCTPVGRASDLMMAPA